MPANMESIRKKIVVVGSGNAGLMAALILQTKFPHYFLSVISSKDIGIIGVGEGTTEHFNDFLRYCKINVYSFIKEAGATFKAGIMFQGWSEEDYLHSVETMFKYKDGEYSSYYSHLMANEHYSKELTTMPTWDNEYVFKHFKQNYGIIHHQYHADTFKLNNFLKTIAKNRGIKFFEDEIIGHQLKENGDIELIKGKKLNYEGEYFIDCSGQKRILGGKIYNTPLKSMKDYLILNRAFAFQTEHGEDNYNLWTRARAMNAGWNWQIPTQERYGNGYVYCDEFITEKEAIKEIEKIYKQKIKVGRSFSFEPMYTTETWTHNCISIGLASNFVEPLEATSMGSTIQQMFTLISFLGSDDKKSFNKHCNIIYENLCDFILLHYLVKKENTPFWKHIKYNLKITDSLKPYLETSKRRLLQRLDFPLSFHLFGCDNFNLVMYGLRLFPFPAIKKEWRNTLAPFQQRDIDAHVLHYHRVKQGAQKITHKKAIELIKERGGRI